MMGKHKLEKLPAYCKVCGVQLPSNRTRFCCDAHGLDWFRSADSVYARTNPPRNCELCGKEYRPATKVSRFCSHSCTGTASNLHRRLTPRACEHCGCSYQPNHSTRKYCGHKCASAHLKQRAVERESAAALASPKPVRPTECVVCGGKLRYSYAKTCSAECRRTLAKAIYREEHPLRSIEKACEHCGTRFVATHQADAHRFCSHRCVKKHGKHNREARKRGQYVAPVSLAEVYARCGGICQLCGEVVDRKLKVPHPMAATLDHIVPLAKGGTHEPSNVQLAHFVCNSLKSDAEQLAPDFGKKMRLRMVSGGYVAKSPELAARPVIRQVRLF